MKNVVTTGIEYYFIYMYLYANPSKTLVLARMMFFVDC